MHTSDVSLSLFCRVGVKNGVKLEKNLNNVKSQRIRIAPLHFSSFSKEERREREREREILVRFLLFGFFCSHLKYTDAQKRKRENGHTKQQNVVAVQIVEQTTRSEKRRREDV